MIKKSREDEQKDVINDINYLLKYKESLTDKVKEDIVNFIKDAYPECVTNVTFTVSPVTGYTSILVQIDDNSYYLIFQLQCLIP